MTEMTVIAETQNTSSQLSEMTPDLVDPDTNWGDDEHSTERMSAVCDRVAAVVAERINHLLPAGYEYHGETGEFLGLEGSDWMELTGEHISEWFPWDADDAVWNVFQDVLATQFGAILAEVTAVADAVAQHGRERSRAKQTLKDTTDRLRESVLTAREYGFSEVYLAQIGEVDRMAVRGWQGKRKR